MHTHETLHLHDHDTIGLNDLTALHAIGLDAATHAHLAALEATTLPPGTRAWRLTEVQRESFTLHDGQREAPARALPALRHALADEGAALAVGDWVLAAPDAHGAWWLHRRLPPRTEIARRTGGDGSGRSGRTVIVSNIDTALLVMGLDHDFNLRRLERYLALVRLAGVTPVVVLTKADLLDAAPHGTGDVAAAPDAPDSPDALDGPARRCRAVQALLPPQGAVLAVDARSARAAEALAPWLHAGATLALLGSSGAGKSTLTNTLCAGSAPLQATGAAREGDSRGRHTTTARTLHRAPGGACIVDTPGLRALRLDVDEAALGQAFDDIGRLSLQCRFRDCRHEGEPGCAVATAVPQERLRNFKKLEREAQRDQQTPLQRRAVLAQYKVRSRATRRRMAEKGR
jgi:ribosome biogenesis GTPase